MTTDETIAYLETLHLVQALWWFIENLSGETSTVTTDVFFYLRERVRSEGAANA